MSTAFHEGTCSCGEFRYAGHRCRHSLGEGPSPTERLRSELRVAESAFDRLRAVQGFAPWETALCGRLLTAEMGRLTAALAEVETEDGDG